jgi:DNA-binding response OmpR family regulator
MASAPFRLLVAEDNEDLAWTMEMLFAEYGYDVRLYPDGAAALRGALEDPPDAAILDIGMPEIDGLRLAEELRRVLPARTLLMAVTAYGSDADRRRALAAGFDCFFAKPADPDELLRVLDDFRGLLASEAAPAPCPPEPLASE